MNVRLTFMATLFAAAASAGLGACMSAQPPLDLPDPSVIGVVPGHGGRALAPACAALDQPSNLRDAGSARPGMEFGCATYSNLAAMLVRPDDLVAPRPYAGADAPLAASAVRRYEEERTRPLRDSNATSSPAAPSSSSSFSPSANATAGSQ